MASKPTETKSVRQRLTDDLVSKLPAPERGNRIYYDASNKRGNDFVRGFGLRVTAGGARSFVINYRTKAGRERRYTIGSPPAWGVTAARIEAGRLKAQIDLGNDPLGDIKAGRDAPTVADLCERFQEEHLPKTRPATRRDYKAIIANEILPALRQSKVADVTYADIDTLHRRITKRGAAYRANRTVAVASKMFNLAIRWGWRSDNPAKGIERNPEHGRSRYLSGDEIARLSKVLAEIEDRQGANIVRLCLLTGARSGEVMAARWDQFDLEAGIWTKPGSATKQKTEHRVPLSAPARQLLVGIREAAEAAARKKGLAVSEYVFPGHGSPHRVDIKRTWETIRKEAKLPDVRVHDLRHSFASVLASAGMSLPIIGALLGHSQPQTTARYAHLFDDPLRVATERVGAIVTGSDKAGEIVPMTKDGARR